VEVHDYGSTADGDLFVAMEYLPGLDLCDWLDEFGAAEVDQATHAILQILDSLAEAHRLGIVHRDLKPENIIVQRPPGPSNNLELKLLDFGLSKYIGDDTASVPGLHVTQDGRVYGTPQYMAPEQACGEPVTPETDIYTVGLLAFEMVDGRPAFVGDSRREIMRRQIVEAIPDLPVALQGTALEGFIEQCTHKEPEDRFANAGAARKWLVSQKKQFDALEELFGLNDEEQADRSAASTADGRDSSPSVDIEADGTLTPSRLSERIADLPLIGREAELAILDEWGDGLAGRGGLLWLYGAPGTGNSRLLREYETRLDDRETVVFSGRFRPMHSTVGTLRELVGELLGRVDHAGGSPDVVGFDTVRRVRQELGVSVEEETHGEVSQAGAMFPALRNALLTIAEARPTILLFDDMHRAEGRAVSFIYRLLDQVVERGTSLGIVATGRTQELRANPPVAQLLARTVDDGADFDADRVAELELEPLDREAAEAFLDHVVPLEPPLRESVVRHASGNPLYLAQVVRYLVEQDLLVEREENRYGLEQRDFGLDQLVPPSLKGLCLRRLRSLARDSHAGRAPMQLLARMAILGDRFEASLLERMLEAEATPKTDALAGALETLTDLDIVGRTELSGEPGFIFSDPVFRKAVLESLDEESERAQTLHRLAARTKVRHLGADRDRRLPDRAHGVAQHLERAGEPDRAVDWYLRSAEHFESVGDLPSALDDLRAAERIVGERESSTDVLRRLTDIRMRVADVARRDGRFGPAEDTLRSILEDLDRLEETSLEAEVSRLLGEVTLHGAKFEGSRGHFDRARELFDRMGAPDKAIRAAIGLADSYRYQGRNAEADDRFRALLEQARELEHPELEGRCRLSLGRSLYADGALPDARQEFDTVFELVDLGSDVYGEALIDCGMVELFRQGPKFAIDRLRRALDHARQRGDLLDEARARVALGMALRRTPALAEAADHVAEAHTIYERAAHRWGIAKAVLLQGEIAWAGGDPKRATQLATDARKLHSDLDDQHGLALSLTYEALFRNTTGHTEEARELLSQALALESNSELELYRSRALFFLGMVEETDNELEEARRRYDEALATARRQEHLEVELLTSISLAKLELVTDPDADLLERVRSIRRRADNCGALYPKLFARAIEAIIAIQNDDDRVETLLDELRAGDGNGGSPDLRIPDRLFRLAQAIARRRGGDGVPQALEAIETLLNWLDAGDLGHRIELQRRTLADGD
ncbi:MAG: AAA family ATPase, partial [Bradymonadaceae bacterium]